MAELHGWYIDDILQYLVKLEPFCNLLHPSIFNILPSIKHIFAQDRLNILLILNTIPKVAEKVTALG